MALNERVNTLAGKDMLRNQATLMKNQDVLCKRITDYLGTIACEIADDVGVLLDVEEIPRKAEREAPGAEQVWDGTGKSEQYLKKINSKLRSVVKNQQAIGEKLTELIQVLSGKDLPRKSG